MKKRANLDLGSNGARGDVFIPDGERGVKLFKVHEDISKKGMKMAASVAIEGKHQNEERRHSTLPLGSWKVSERRRSHSQGRRLGPVWRCARYDGFNDEILPSQPVQIGKQEEVR